ncbi:iron-containing redox enzyme family protein [Ascidiimonas aurantiaca]|uniref:iron-containing redox enzyme family protein n=1 Tax=Ascidiimonas aurantiaca TaxID=1685432 RepID=UPI0030ED4307
MQVQDYTKNEYFERVAEKKLPFLGTYYESEHRVLALFLQYLQLVPNDPGFHKSDFKNFIHLLNKRIVKAFKEEDDTALLEIHLILYTIYEIYLMNPMAPAVKHLNQNWLISIKNQIETPWIEKERDSIKHLLPKASELTNFDRFRSWLVNISEDKDPVNKIVTDYFKNDATLEDFKRFIHIDQHLNHRFYDAIALTLPHFSESIKAQLSHHYWEEAGEGNHTKAHTYQFTKILDHLGIEINNTPPWNDWRAFAGFNIYFLFAFNREHYFKAIGSLGMPELFDVNRDSELVAGLDRLGEDVEKHYFYYIAHVEMDAEHGNEWLDLIVKKMVEQEPDSAEEIAIGALIRMKYMRLFNQYLCKTFDISVSSLSS